MLNAGAVRARRFVGINRLIIHISSPYTDYTRVRLNTPHIAEQKHVGHFGNWAQLRKSAEAFQSRIGNQAENHCPIGSATTDL